MKITGAVTALLLSALVLGAGIVFDKSVFNKVDKTQDMVRIISVPSTEVSATIVSASTKENIINTDEAFEAYVKSLSDNR